MSETDFIFLKDEFPDIFEYCVEIEKNIIDHEYKSALSTARDAIELTIKIIYSKEKLEYPRDLATAITNLSRKKVINPTISRQYHEIKDAGNFYSHSNKLPGGKIKKRDKSPQEESFNIHHKLYNVESEFYKEFNDAIDPYDVGRYNGINLEKVNISQNVDNDKLDEVLKSIEGIKEKLDEPNSNLQQEINSDSENINSQYITNERNKFSFEDYGFNKINGSWLLGGLTKLNDSSKESVEGSESLSKFKNYLHVERNIEEELSNKLEDSLTSKCKLIMLCGSVGDGKSHLIAHLNDTHPDLMKNFTIVNDATESEAFNKTCIDTLVNKLSSFDDDHIDETDEKLLLLINLGVLNNFIHSDIVNQKFSRLLNKLDNLSIFDSDDFSNKLDDDFISVISFSDYYIFEFDQEHPNKVKSNFVSELFSKIASPNEENPFYEAYWADKNDGVNNSIIKNYEFFMMPNVQDMIIFNIIKIIIKYKMFISTRELLNFIYEILVPANITNFDGNYSSRGYLEELLPNLLFGSDDRGDILKAINLEDPTLKRVEITDNLLIDLNTGMELLDLFNKYMDIEDLSFFEDIFDFDVIYNDYKDEDKKIISMTILRLSNLFGKEEVKNNLNKKSYLDYIDYLYYYNVGEQKHLKNLISDIEHAIFTWKGRLSNDYICIEKLNKFKLGKSLNIEFKGISNLGAGDLNRFKTSMSLPFFKNGCPDESIKLNVDYSLYEVITKLVKGYKPNNSEQKDLILFNEFIDNIISFNSSNKCFICSNDEKNCFKLEYNGTFDEYIFKRVI